MTYIVFPKLFAKNCEHCYFANMKSDGSRTERKQEVIQSDRLSTNIQVSQTYLKEKRNCKIITQTVSVHRTHSLTFFH